MKISRSSYHVLCDYTYSDLKKIAYIRRENLDMMNYIMSRRFPDATPLLGPEVDAPYVAAYLIDNAENKRRITKDMINTGFALLQWADPACLFEDNKGQEQAISVFDKLILLPIHQAITPQMLVKRFL